MSKLSLLFVCVGVSLMLMAFSCHYQGENHFETAKEVSDVSNISSK